MRGRAWGVYRMAVRGMVLALAKVVWMKERKRFFFEKKKQKTFGLAGVGTNAPQPAGPEVFLLLFFQKKKRLLALFRRQKGVDGPVKPGHDGWGFRRHDGERRVWGSGGRWVC